MSEKHEHGIFDTLKHLAFEDEPATTKTEVHPAHAAAIQPPAFPVQSPVSFVPPVTMPTPPSLVPDNDQAYQQLLAKTDFERTAAAATIHKFLDPLAAIADNIMPPNVKFRTAVVQAKAQAGLTEDSILAIFDSLQATLQQEHQAFEAKAQQFAAREISGRQEHINKVTAQIAELQQELSQLSTELIDAQGKAARAQAQFAAAVQRRQAEIEQQKAQYSALLKG